MERFWFFILIYFEWRDTENQQYILIKLNGYWAIELNKYRDIKLNGFRNIA